MNNYELEVFDHSKPWIGLSYEYVQATNEDEARVMFMTGHSYLDPEVLRCSLLTIAR